MRKLLRWNEDDREESRNILLGFGRGEVDETFCADDGSAVYEYGGSADFGCDACPDVGCFGVRGDVASEVADTGFGFVFVFRFFFFGDGDVEDYCPYTSHAVYLRYASA